MRLRHRVFDPQDGTSLGQPGYAQIVLVVLILLIWFSALAKGGNDLWAVTAVCAWLFLATLAFVIGCTTHKIRVYLPLGPAFLLLLTGFVLSAQSSYDLNTTRLEMWIWFLGSLAFFLFANAASDPLARRRIVQYGGLVLIPIAVIGVGQGIQNPTAFWGSHGLTRGTFTNSAVLGGMAISWAVIFWHYRKEDLAYRWLFGASLLALFLAQSWSAPISFLIGFMYYYKKRIKSIMKPIQIRILYLSCAGALLLAVLAKASGSLADRWEWWRAGLRMAMDHPLVGIGLGSYGTAFPFFKPPGLLNTLFAHSFPIQVLSETGLIGLVAVIFFFVSYLLLISKDKSESEEAMAYQSAVVSILVFSLTSIFLDYFVGKLLLFMMMALSLTPDHDDGFYLSKRAAGFLILGLILMVPGWILPFRASQIHVEGLRHLEAKEPERARDAFQRAIQLNSFQDESYAELAHLYRRTDAERWQNYLNQAADRKRDIRYILELAHPPKSNRVQ